MLSLGTQVVFLELLSVYLERHVIVKGLSEWIGKIGCLSRLIYCLLLGLINSLSLRCCGLAITFPWHLKVTYANLDLIYSYLIPVGIILVLIVLCCLFL